jgi:4-aminobutyrate aminotransferase-like enzyme
MASERPTSREPSGGDFARYDTAELKDKDRDHYIHPWTDFSTFKKQGSMVIAESDGAYVYDSDGTRYLDVIGGLWCVNVGYGNREIATAMAEQACRVPMYSPFGHITTPPSAELAAKLADLAPGDLNHVFYGTGGSMANDTAVRIIHFYFNRLGMKSKKQIISRIDGYHGSTYLAMTITGVEFDHLGFDLATDLVNRVSAPDVYRRPAGMSPSGTSRASSPSRSRAPAAFSSPRWDITRAQRRSARSTTSSTSRMRSSPPSVASARCLPRKRYSIFSQTSSSARRGSARATRP